MNRRKLLGRIGVVAGAGAIAGCLDDGNEDEDEDDEDSDSDSQTDPITTKSIETLEAQCGSKDEASIEPHDGTVTIHGYIEASTPCHEAIFESGLYEDGTLTLTIGLESTLEDDEGCIQCVGEIEYEADVEFEKDRPKSIVVEHESAAGTRTVSRLDFDSDEGNGESGE